MTTATATARLLRELAANRQMPDDARVTTLTIGELRDALATERRLIVQRSAEIANEVFDRFSYGRGSVVRDVMASALLDELGEQR